MEITEYRVCNGSECESYTAVAMDIEDRLGLKNVRIDPQTGKVTYDNPQNCRVDEKLLEEAARNPGRNIEFEVCTPG